MSNPVIQSAPQQVSIVQKGTVAPRGAEPGLPTDTPLETNIGMGYDVFASGGKDVRMPVYEMGVPTKAATSETGYDIMAPKNTKCTGLSATNKGYSYTKQYAKTAEEMSQYLAVSAGIEGTVGAFKGSLEGSFSTKVTSDVTQLFTLLETVVQRYQFTLTGGSSFTDDFTKAVNGLEGKTWASDASAFETFFDDYGTHVVTGIIMGAKLSAYVLTTTETHVTTWDLKVNLEASYGTISGQGEGTYNDKQTQVKEATDAQGSASGGDITLAAGVIVNDTFNKDAYLAWVSSVSAADWPLQMAEITYTLSPINSHLPDGVSKDLTSELAKAFKAYCQAQAQAANLPTGTPVVVSIQLLDMHVINDADQHSPGEFFWDFTLLNQQGTTIGTLSSVARAAYVSGLTDGTKTSFPTLIKKAKEAGGKDADKDVIGNGSVNLQFYPDDVSASFKVLGTLTEVDAGSSNDDFNPYDSSQTVDLPPTPAAAAAKLPVPTKLVFDVAHFYGAQDKTGKARTYTMNFAGVNGGPGNVQVTYQISFSPPLP